MYGIIKRAFDDLFTSNIGESLFKKSLFNWERFHEWESFWDKKDDTYEYEVEVAGYTKEAIKITLNESENILKVVAEDEKRGNFKFEITTPSDAKNLKASLENGILTLKMDIDKKKEAIRNIELE